MKLNIVGGFLGSGKTTAITNGSKVLMQLGQQVAVVTNDQGKYLVDTRFVDSNEIPTAEVTNGCFCCNFNSLTDQIEYLEQKFNPDIIFAESVGSCTDLVATVLKPLQLLKKELFDELTFSVFVDSRLLLEYLLDKKLPFSDAIAYIFEKQLEEAEFLIVNKVDLLSVEDNIILRKLTNTLFGNKVLIFQNSLNPENIQQWLVSLEKPAFRRKDVLDIDYQVYGKGEADLAWLDEEIDIQTDDLSAWKHAIEFIDSLISQINSYEIPIGHLKFLLQGEGVSHKISFTTIFDEDWKKWVPDFEINSVQLMVNSRIETTPDVAKEIVKKGVVAISGAGVFVSENHKQAFQPGFPNPTHRITQKMACCEECRCIKNMINSQIEACLCECNLDDGCCCSF